MRLTQTIIQWTNSTLAHVACSFLLMGGWAAFANASHPMPAPLIAGLIQGALSATITLVMKKALERTYDFWCRYGRPVVGVIATPLMVCSVSATSLIVFHAIAGTPELIATVIVPSGVALFYASIYTIALWRQIKKAALTS